jgi:Na+/proline symporter
VGWRRIARQIPEVRGDEGFGSLVISWLAGVVLVYTMLFGVGMIILREYVSGALYMIIGVIACVVIYRNLARRGFGTVVR